MPRFLCLILILLFLPAVCLAEATVTVRGLAELSVPADQAVFTLALITEGKSSEQILSENSQQMEKVLTALRRTGLDGKEMTTGQFTIDPLWSQRSGKSSDFTRPQIIGFRVSNQILVQTLKLDLVGKLIAAAVDAGANRVNGLRFGLSAPRSYQQEAIRVATRKAHEDATVLVDAGGGKLGRLVSLSLDDARSISVAAPRAMYAEKAVASIAPPLSASDVTVRATVTAVYAIDK